MSDHIYYRLPTEEAVELNAVWIFTNLDILLFQLFVKYRYLLKVDI